MVKEIILFVVIIAVFADVHIRKENSLPVTAYNSISALLKQYTAA